MSYSITQSSEIVNIKPYRQKKLKTEYLSKVYYFLYFHDKNPNLCRMARWAKKSQAVKLCGTLIRGDVYIDITNGDKQLKITGANFCRELLCPLCMWRRAEKLYSNMLRTLDYIYTDYRSIEFDKSGNRLEPRLRPLLLTLTVVAVPGDQIRATCKRMSDAWHNLMKDKQIKQSIKGYYRCLELNYNPKANTFNPHFHVLLLTTEDYFKSDNYITLDRWRDIWRRCMQDYSIWAVDIRPLKGKTTTQLMKSINEVCKYTVKTTDYLSGNIERDAYITSTLDTELKGIRRACFGGWIKEARRALKIEDEDDSIDHDDFIDSSKLKKYVPDVWLHWDSGLGDYII